MSFKDKCGAAAIVLLCVVCLSGIVYGMYSVKRWWNYNLGYQSQVEATICKTVKKEYLINPDKCK